MFEVKKEPTYVTLSIPILNPCVVSIENWIDSPTINYFSTEKYKYTRISEFDSQWIVNTVSIFSSTNRTLLVIIKETGSVISLIPICIIYQFTIYKIIIIHKIMSLFRTWHIHHNISVYKLLQITLVWNPNLNKRP